MKKFALGALFLTAALNQRTVLAEDPPPYNPKFDVHPDLKEKFLKRLDNKKRPTRSHPEREVDASVEDFEVKGRLEAFEDGVFLLSTEIREEFKQQLVTRGFLVVTSRESVRNNTIFEQRFYRTFGSLMPFEEAERATKYRVGKDVKLKLKRNKNAQQLVVDVHL